MRKYIKPSIEEIVIEDQAAAFAANVLVCKTATVQTGTVADACANADGEPAVGLLSCTLPTGTQYTLANQGTGDGQWQFITS